MRQAAVILASYILGGIPFGLCIGLVFFKKDLREHGSQNIGATNAYRVFGWRGGIPAFVLDLLKGLLPVMVARQLFPLSPHMLVLAGVAAILGHTASPFLAFHGGKGVATSLGVATALAWKGGLIAFLTWAAIVLLTGYVSIASIIATAVGATLIYVYNGRNLLIGILGAFATIYVLIRHRSNIQRLIKGQENRFSLPWFKRKLDAANPVPDEPKETTE